MQRLCECVGISKVNLFLFLLKSEETLKGEREGFFSRVTRNKVLLNPSTIVVLPKYGKNPSL